MADTHTYTATSNFATLRALCDECREPMQYAWFDFVAGEQQIKPCGHHAGIYFELVPRG